MTADSTRTGPTRLAKHSQWPQYGKKQQLLVSEVNDPGDT